MVTKNRLLDKTAGLMDDLNLDVKSVREAREPRTAMGTMMAIREQIGDEHKNIKELEEKLKVAESKQGVQKIPLDQLHKVPGRQRSLSVEEFNSLKDNLNNNSLDTPITVLPRVAGGYEIVSGHNRVDAYRALGKSEIEAIVKNYASDAASKIAFYSNLLHPSLSDFEKFLGFKKQIAEKKFTQKEISVDSGIAEPIISRLMSFEDLPADALAFIASNPTIRLGAQAAADLAVLAKKDGVFSESVTEAIKAIVNEQITQADAVERAKKAARPANSIVPDKPETIKIKSGKSVFASVTGYGKNLRIVFADEDGREQLEQKIKETIENFIEKFNK